MLVAIPTSTTALFEELDESVKKLPKEDRNAFVLDLMKFAIDWQFSYLAFQQAQEGESNAAS